MLFCCVLIFFEASTVQRAWTINSSYDECSAILAEVANPLSKLGYTRCCRVPGAKKSLRFEPGRCQFWWFVSKLRGSCGRGQGWCLIGVLTPHKMAPIFLL